MLIFYSSMLIFNLNLVRSPRGKIMLPRAELVKITVVTRRYIAYCENISSQNFVIFSLHVRRTFSFFRSNLL